MLEILVYALFCFFAAYGLITALMRISQAALHKKEFNKAINKNGIQLVLLVKNHGHDIEGIIRNMFEGDFMSRIMADRELKVVDLGSEDETLDILEKMKEKYGSIDIVKTSSGEYEPLSSILESWVM